MDLFKSVTDEAVRIFMVGKTGSGKSSTGNSLLGKKSFSVGLDFGSITTRCQVREGKNLGMAMKVTDSPGLFDTNKTQEEIASILMHGVTAMHPGPDVILYVTKVGRYTEEEHGAYERLKALLDTNFTNHMIVVFSHGDLLKGHDIAVMLKSAPKELKQVLKECSNRYVVIDNTATNNLAQALLQAAISAKPHYNSIRSRHVRVWHDTGVLSYCSSSDPSPVAQFISAKPLKFGCNNFAIEIVNGGQKRAIGIGLCPRDYAENRMPGWDFGSVGYHADDGGIYKDDGYAKARFDRCYKGDVMVCELDLLASKVFFYRNYELVCSVSDVAVPIRGLHPMVGMMSPGEAVRLLQREPWQ